MKYKILVIEDNLDHQKILEKFLDAQFDIDFVSRASAGLEKQTAHQYDLILVDFELGNMSGLDFLRLAREYRTDCPIVLMSSKMPLELKLEALEAGAEFCVEKAEIFAQKENLRRLLNHLIGEARNRSKIRKLVSLYASIFENNFRPVLLLDASGKILRASREFREILRVSQDDIIYNKLPRFVEKDVRPELLLFLKRVLAGEEIRDFSLKLRDLQNRQMEVMLRGRPIEVNHQVHWVLLEVQSPVFAPKMENMWERFLEWLRQIHNSLVVVDAHEQIVFWNAEATRLFNLPHFRGQTLPLDHLLQIESVRQLRRGLALVGENPTRDVSLKFVLTSTTGNTLNLNCQFVGEPEDGLYLVIRGEAADKFSESYIAVEDSLKL